ncbi:aminotransferase class I/II-fold pyridoxal phosphate-dependent enzyme [Nanoarchaeota archaeon]
MRIHNKLKNRLSNFLGLRNVVLSSSCRNALYLLLRSLDLNGKEVIVQSFICNTLPIAIEKAGGKPVLVDVNKETFNLDSKEVEKKISEKTKAVIFVHTYGNPTGIVEIKKLCEKYNLILIEDLAQSLGASYNGKTVGSFGDYSILSFTKQVINIGGGAVMSNNDLTEIEKLKNQLDKNTEPSLIEYPKRLITSLYEARAFSLSKLLIDLARKKENLKVALNLDPHYNCSNIEAYMMLNQLKSLRKKTYLRKRNFMYMIKEGVETQKISEHAESSYLYLSFRLPNKKFQQNVVEKDFLFLPPWNGGNISDKLVFVPNNPKFTKKRLKKLILNYRNVLNNKNLSDVNAPMV